MHVLITGGTGFIGSRLALKYLEAGSAVKVLGQENNPAEAENSKLMRSRGAEVILASIAEREKLFELLENVDVVYHLAAAQHEANVPDQRFWDVNVAGTRNLLEASANARVKRFVYGSTIGVYGSASKAKIHEKSPLTPDNIYGITKLEAEKLVLSYRGTLPVTVLRISETYGPGDRRLLKLFKAIKRNMFFMIGKGTNTHHLIYIDDLTEALVLAATVERAVGQIFVIAGGEVVTSNDMVELIAQQLGTNIPGIHFPLRPALQIAGLCEMLFRPFGVQPPLHRRRMDFFRKSFAFSQNEAEKILGCGPKVRLKEGIAQTTRWYAEMGYL